MVVKKKTNEVLDIAIARGNKPIRHVATGRVTIATNQSAKGRNTYKVLQHEDGSVTDAGKYYYDKTGEQHQSDLTFRSKPGASSAREFRLYQNTLRMASCQTLWSGWEDASDLSWLQVFQRQARRIYRGNPSEDRSNQLKG
jgi:hypothetical protein